MNRQFKKLIQLKPENSPERLARNRPRVGGFSLIELLVAILVMGIGVLGISALQLVSMQNNREALLQSEATLLAYSMMDRIRANPIGTPAGDGYDGLDLGDDPPNSQNCQSNACSAAQMVRFDQAVWKCQLGRYLESSRCESLRDEGVLPDADQLRGLPEGDGAIEVDSGSGLITVTVAWTGMNDETRTVAVDSRG